MFRGPPPNSRPARRKWHPDDEETVLHDDLEGQDSPQGDPGWVPTAAQLEPVEPPAAGNAPDSPAAEAALPPEDTAAPTRSRTRWPRLPRFRRPAPETAFVPAAQEQPASADTHLPEVAEAEAGAPFPPAAGQPLAEVPGAALPGQAASPRSNVRWGWVFLPLSMLALAASWFGLPIREVAVSGNQHLSAEAVVQAAGVGHDSGWLYYGARQAAGLTRNPWVETAAVTRQFPDRLSIHITERQPYAVLRESGHLPVVVARDGTPLPGAPLTAELPSISGWGPERTRDALTALEALAPYHVQSVEYTPSGLSVKSADSSAWSGDLESLLKYAGALAEYPNQQIHIYPWGVSVQE